MYLLTCVFVSPTPSKSWGTCQKQYMTDSEQEDSLRNEYKTIEKYRSPVPHTSFATLNMSAYGVTLGNISAGIYLFKVNNGNIRTMCDICSKSTIKLTERRC